MSEGCVLLVNSQISFAEPFTDESRKFAKYMTKDQIYHMFSVYGKVLDVKMGLHGKAIASVKFADKRDADDALLNLQDICYIKGDLAKRMCAQDNSLETGLIVEIEVKDNSEIPKIIDELQKYGIHGKVTIKQKQ